MWLIQWAIRAGCAMLLAAFFGFVGFMKAWAPMRELAIHHAWVTVLPVWAARIVGVSEVACALALLGAFWPGRPRDLACIAALLLIANQCVAATVHAVAGEGIHPLIQNAVLVAMLATVALTSGARRLIAR